MAIKSTASMTSGKPIQLVLRMGFPLFLGNVLQQLYNFVDTVVVGQGIGVDALAAVGLTGSIHFLVLGFVMGMAQGVSILVSQYFGASDPDHLRRAVTMSAVVNYTTGVIVTVLAMAYARWILTVMQTPIDILPLSLTYLQIIFGGILISLTYNFLSGILRGFGDSHNPLIAMIIAFVVNTILDIGFVVGLKMGVAGAAWATITAQGVSAVYCFWCCSRIPQLKLTRKDWNLDGKMIAQTFRLSFPVAIMNSITAVGVIFLQTAINLFGQVYIAAYSTASKIIILLEQISSSFGLATGTYVGQNLGARLYDRIRQGVRSMQIAVMAMNGISAVLMIFFGRFLLSLMIAAEEVEVIQMAYHCLIVLSPFLLALGVLWVFRCSLQSMSDTFFPMLSGILELLARTVCIVLLPRFLGFDGVLFSEVAAWIAAAIMLGIVYYWRLGRLLKTGSI